MNLFFDVQVWKILPIQPRTSGRETNFQSLVLLQSRVLKIVLADGVYRCFAKPERHSALASMHED